MTKNKVQEKLGREEKRLLLEKQRRLRNYGHIKRQNGFFIHTLDGYIEGERPRGSPPKTWIRNIAK